MQNVATGKSELAALPQTFSSDSSVVIKDSSEFLSFLRDASNQHFTQPVDPEMPISKDDNKLSDANLTAVIEPETTENHLTAEKPEVGKQQVGDGQLEDDSFTQLDHSTELVEEIVVQDITMLPAVTVGKNSNANIDGIIKDNTDLAAELDSFVPKIDLLDLLEQSQFKEITISQRPKAASAGQLNDIQGLVEHIRTLSEQSSSSADADTNAEIQTINTVLNKFIVALDEQNIASESPIKLTELLLKIQSDIELENDTKILPTIEGGQQAELDIELLTIVVAEDNSTSETPDMTEKLLEQVQQNTAEPLQPTTHTGLKADLNQEPVAAIEIATEDENLVIPQLIHEELIEQPDVGIHPAEIENLGHSVDSKDIRQILNLSPEKLDKALENLANRLIQIDSATSKDIENQAKIPSTIKQDFIASLKSSIDEIKSQLKQGKQIDTNLKSFVVDSLNHVSQEFNPDTVSATISRFTQTLELSSALMAHASTNSTLGLETAVGISAIDRALTKENQSQSNLLQVKQAKQQVVQFEKAVNIVRSEGHHQLVEKVRWMVNQNNLQAEIRLDPPDLGAMKVRVSLSGETASVNIVVQSQQAKDLLDSAAPKLRDLLQEQGIQLGQSSVEQEQRQRNHDKSAVASGNSELSNEAEPEAGHQVSEQTIVNGQLSGIDYFV